MALKDSLGCVYVAACYVRRLSEGPGITAHGESLMSDIFMAFFAWRRLSFISVGVAGGPAGILGNRRDVVRRNAAACGGRAWLKCR